MMKQGHFAIAKGLLFVCALFAAQAQAATISRYFAGNDCAGYFGDNFGACTLFIDYAGDTVEFSPVIAKYEFDEDTQSLFLDDINTALYPSVDGSEFSFSNTTTDYKTGTWDYTRGTDDPGARYWATKAGDAFLLNWQVDDSAVASGGVCDVADPYSVACLAAAIVVTTGDWTTPDNKGLSHITFYDTSADNGGTPPVPLPAAAWLFGSALLGLMGVARRKQNA